MGEGTKRCPRHGLGSHSRSGTDDSKPVCLDVDAAPPASSPTSAVGSLLGWLLYRRKPWRSAVGNRARPAPSWSYLLSSSVAALASTLPVRRWIHTSVCSGRHNGRASRVGSLKERMGFPPRSFVEIIPQRAAVIAAVMIAGCSPFAQPTARASSTPTGPSLTSPIPLESPPANCATVGSPQQLNPAFGPGIGGPPVWIIAASTTIHVGFGDGTLRGVTHTDHGWSVKVLWVVEPSYSQQIHVSGGAIDSGQPLWMQFSGPPVKSAVLDPTKAPTGTGGWPGFPSYLFIPRATCYFITASWPQGRWRLVVSAGL